MTTQAWRLSPRVRPIQVSSAISPPSVKASAKSSTPASIPEFISGPPTTAAPGSDGRSADLPRRMHSDAGTASRSRKGPRSVRALLACEPTSLAQLPQKPHLRERPVAFDGFARDIQDLGRLLDAQPTEEAQLYDPALALIDIGQRVERVVERHHVCRLAFGDFECLSEQDPLRAAPAFLVAARSREVHENAPHQSRRHRKKMGAVLPLHLFEIDQPQVGFVDERCRLKRMAWPFGRHLSQRQPSQLLVDDRHELLQRVLVAVFPRSEERRVGNECTSQWWLSH